MSQPHSQPSLTLQVLGCPELRLGEHPLKCSNTALRVLAVLALDGPTARLQLADLLWDAPTDRALHNLRMALYTLRRTLGTYADILTEQRGHLSLDLNRVSVDTLPVHVPGLAAAPNQEFMSGHRTSGSENWLEWATQTEERLLISRRVPSATPVIFRQQTVQTPLPWPNGMPAPPALEAAPPPLIGREKVIDQILQATEKRRVVMVLGEAGSGKSTLNSAIRRVFDHNTVVPSVFKPNDTQYPLSTMYRALRVAQEIFGGRQLFPDVPDQLVYEAIQNLARAGLPDLLTLTKTMFSEVFSYPITSWADDVHRWDDLSNRLAGTVTAEALRQTRTSTVIATCRPAEMTQGLRELNLELLESGQMLVVTLEALTITQTAELADYYFPFLSDTQVSNLFQFTGGNPGLLTSLLQDASTRHHWPERLALPSAEAIPIRWRMELLNQHEREVLRLATLCEAPYHFSVALACDILGKTEQTVLDAVEKLYQCGYLIGNRVSPPALQQVVVQSMPHPTRLHLLSKLRSATNAVPNAATPRFDH